MGSRPQTRAARLLRCGAERRALHLRDFKGSTEEDEEEDVNPLRQKKKATGRSREKQEGDEGATVAEGGDGMEEEDVEELYDLASYSDQEEDSQEEEEQVDSEFASTCDSHHRPQHCRRVQG